MELSVELKGDLHRLAEQLRQITGAGLAQPKQRAERQLQQLLREVDGCWIRSLSPTLPRLSRMRLQEKLLDLRCLVEDLETQITQLLAQQTWHTQSEQTVDQGQTRWLQMLQQFVQDWDPLVQVVGMVQSVVDAERLHLAIAADGSVLSIRNSERLEHLLCAGATGVGKTAGVLEPLLLQDVFAGRGGFSCEPMGGASRKLMALVGWVMRVRQQFPVIQVTLQRFFEPLARTLAQGSPRLPSAAGWWHKLSLLRELQTASVEAVLPELNVWYLDLSKDGQTATHPQPWRYNPFQLEPGETLGEAVYVLLRTVERFTATPSTQTPRIRIILRALFAYCIAYGRSLKELMSVLDLFRRYAGQGTKHALPLPEGFLAKLEEHSDETAQFAAQYIRHELLRFNKSEFAGIIEGVINRCSFLLDNALVSRLMDTPETTLPLTELVNHPGPRRPFLVAYVPGHEDGGDFAATYLLTKIEAIVFRRQEAQKALFFGMYLDEFGRYVDETMATNFSSIRQMGGAYHCFFQNSGQLNHLDDTGYVFSTVLNNSATKVIMRTTEDAELFAKRCFQVTGMKAKLSYSTSVGVKTALAVNASRSTNTSTSTTEGLSSSSAENWSQTVSNTVAEGLSQGHSTQTSESVTQGTSTSKSQGQSLSESRPQYRATALNTSETRGHSGGQTEGHSSGTGRSSGSSDSVTSTRSESQSTGSSTGGSLSQGRSTSQGQSMGQGQSTGESFSVGASQSWGMTLQYYSLQEEQLFLAQQIMALAPREAFVAFQQLAVHHATTFDSLIVKLADQLRPLSGERFYPWLWEWEAGMRAAMRSLLAREAVAVVEEAVLERVELPVHEIQPSVSRVDSSMETGEPEETATEGSFEEAGSDDDWFNA